MERQPVRRFGPDPDAPRPPDDAWPVTVPAVSQLVREGLELGPGATVLVGENGSGESTVLEMLAAALGLNAEGGSAGARHETRRSEPGSLDGLREATWSDLELTASWRQFLADPQSFLRLLT